MKRITKETAAFLSKMGITLQVFKTALAAGIAWWVSKLVFPDLFPFLAPLAAVLITNTTIQNSIQKALFRMAGVIGGVTISVAIAHILPISGFTVFISILVGMAVSTALNIHKEIVSQIGVTATMVLAFMSSSGYGYGRIVETAIGAFIGVAINLLIVPSSSFSAYIKGLQTELSEAKQLASPKNILNKR
ncbi:FUSC family protein [Priestia koreensis]|uniref:FUSC family protein n=1 Tax=Priestia koreensis TaxID=284581 RepID=UPI001F577093|nr:FUSC family protein [Priestia koreensis]MCM3004491.1 aromatic acid exporter family protein [Priestia koreensis]UNL84699.1 FUSC family protein [Priestia koreensis]